MGKFKSTLENIAKQKAIGAVNGVIREIDGTVRIYIGDYYADYNPKRYVRTGRLGDSVESIPAKQDGVGAVGEVRIVNSKYDVGQWDVYQVVEAADNLTHGGYNVGSGVSVWETPIEDMKKDEYAIWANALVDAGFDI